MEGLGILSPQGLRGMIMMQERMEAILEPGARSASREKHTLLVLSIPEVGLELQQSLS